MKKLSLLIVCLTVVFFMGSNSALAFTEETTVDLTLTIWNTAHLSITNASGDGSVLELGPVTAGKTNYYGATRAIFQNNGTDPYDIQLKAEVTGLTLIDNGPAVGGDEVRLSGIFVNWEVEDIDEKFGNDAITTTYQNSTSSKYADPADEDKFKGIDVPIGGGSDRNLKFAVEAGIATTEGVESTITVYAKAVPAS